MNQKTTMVVFMVMSLIYSYNTLCATSRVSAEKAREQPCYVGMKKCKDCHPEYVNTYSKWKYSRNFRILEMRGKENDPECVPCHTTGYGQPGGFVSVQETPHMKNVQCEACHGPASLHVKAPTAEEHQRTLSVPENTCTTCHHQHRHRRF
jgi:hypothetical protein